MTAAHQATAAPISRMEAVKIKHNGDLSRSFDACLERIERFVDPFTPHPLEDLPAGRDDLSEIRLVGGGNFAGLRTSYQKTPEISAREVSETSGGADLSVLNSKSVVAVIESGSRG